MNSTSLRVVAAHRPPFVFYNGNRTSFQFSGMLIDLLPTLLGYAQINSRIEFYNAPANEGGEILPNGSWTGVMGELVQGKADIALFPLLLEGARPDYIDMTYSYLDGGTTILVQRGSYSPSVLGFLDPFTWQVWVVLVCAVMIVTMVHHLLSWLSPFGDFDKIRIRQTQPQAPQVHKYIVETRSGSPLSEALQSMMGAPCVPQSSSSSHRFLQLAWAFVCLVLLNTYTAGLAALFTVQQLTQKFNSIQDLVDMATGVGIVPQDAAVLYGAASADSAMRALQSRLRSLPDMLASVSAVRNGSITAAFGEYYSMQYWAGTLPCTLQVVGNAFGPASLVVGLRKNSPYTEAMNEAILQMRGNGVIDTLKRRWVADLDQCEDAASQYGGGALSIQTLQGIFYMLLVFMIIAFVWVGGEHAAMKLDRRYPKQSARIRAGLEWVDRHRGRHKRVTVLRRFSTTRWSGRRRIMGLSSLSLGRAASSSRAGSEAEASSDRSTSRHGRASSQRRFARRTTSDTRAASATYARAPSLKSLQALPEPVPQAGSDAAAPPLLIAQGSIWDSQEVLLGPAATLSSVRQQETLLHPKANRQSSFQAHHQAPAHAPDRGAAHRPAADLLQGPSLDQHQHAPIQTQWRRSVHPGTGTVDLGSGQAAALIGSYGSSQ